MSNKRRNVHNLRYKLLDKENKIGAFFPCSSTKLTRVFSRILAVKFCSHTTCLRNCHWFGSVQFSSAQFSLVQFSSIQFAFNSIHVQFTFGQLFLFCFTSRVRSSSTTTTLHCTVGFNSTNV